MSIPEVKVLPHLDLLPYVHQSLLLGWLVDFVIEAYRYDIYFLDMIDIVSA